MSPQGGIRFDGVDYSPEGIESARQRLVETRDMGVSDAEPNWPTITFLSYVIALLADYHTMRVAEEEWRR